MTPHARARAGAAPRVSVALPVFNGEPFLDKAIQSLLEQDFEDLELVISDNASTDATEEICRHHARNDRRVRYVRQPVNRGAAHNFTHLLDLVDPASDYVKWAAADDEHAPTYLSRTVALLDADPTVALAHTGTADIDEEGFALKVWHQPVARLASPDPAERLRDLVTMRHECFGAFGVIRHDVVSQTRGLLPYSDADNVLLVEIALRGRFAHCDDILFFRRQHANRSTVAFPQARGRRAWFDPDADARLDLPLWRVGREFVRAIHDAPLSRAERRRCYASLSVFLHDNALGLAKNVGRTAADAARRVPIERSEPDGPAPSTAAERLATAGVGAGVGGDPTGPRFGAEGGHGR